MSEAWPISMFAVAAGRGGVVQARRGLRLVIAAVAALLLAGGTSPNARAALSWSAPMPLEPSTPGLFNASVSCASRSLCVAVDTLGNVISSTNPTGGPAAWRAVKLDAGQFGLRSVSCPSASFCAAVDFSGVFVSSDPAGGGRAWTRVMVFRGPGGLIGVSCASAKFCVAVAGTGTHAFASTDPTGGAGAWHSVRVSSTDKFMNGLACPSAKLCVAVDEFGSVFTSTNPGSGTPWTETSTGYRALIALSCPSTSLCVAGDGTGNVVISANPTGGSGAWSIVHADPSTKLCGGRSTPGSMCPAAVLSVSCASVSLCVASDSYGNVVATTHPLGGAAAWNVMSVDPGGFVGFGLSGMSCPSLSLCVGVDPFGGLVLGQGSTPSEIKARLLRDLIPSPKWRQAGRLLKQGGYAFWFDAITRGRVVIGWYYAPSRAGRGIGKPKRVLVASSTHVFTTAGPVLIKIKLTAAGKKLLASPSNLRLVARGTFRPTHESAVVATTTFAVTR